ncbi:MAG TPA: iron-sulfur cluster assembly accessory protein [bacterium]|jgi:iron-sulfur cluster assembly protein
MITVTERAISEVRKLITQKNAEVKGLRVGVKGGGCSGLSYFLDFENMPRPDDNIMEFDGIKLFLDPKSALYLKGTQLDFSDGLNGKGFTFSNPNAQRTCGCGSSFSI